MFQTLGQFCLTERVPGAGDPIALSLTLPLLQPKEPGPTRELIPSMMLAFQTWLERSPLKVQATLQTILGHLWGRAARFGPEEEAMERAEELPETATNGRAAQTGPEEQFQFLPKLQYLIRLQQKIRQLIRVLPGQYQD